MPLPWISILFVCSVIIAMSSTRSNNGKIVSHKNKNKVTKQRLAYTVRNVQKGTMARLRSLRQDLAGFVATYSRPPNFVTVKLKYLRTRGTNSVKGWKRVTKSTTKPPYSTKRTYPGPRDRRDSILSYLLNVFSLFNNTLKKKLISKNRRPERTHCYLIAHSAFMKNCFYGYFVSTKPYLLGGLKQMRKMLAQVCSVEWMSASRVVYILETCCQHRFKFTRFRSQQPDYDETTETFSLV